MPSFRFAAPSGKSWIHRWIYKRILSMTMLLGLLSVGQGLLKVDILLLYWHSMTPKILKSYTLWRLWFWSGQLPVLVLGEGRPKYPGGPQVRSLFCTSTSAETCLQLQGSQWRSPPIPHRLSTVQSANFLRKFLKLWIVYQKLTTHSSFSQFVQNWQKWHYCIQRN